jgi:hypothetical protein
MPASNVPGNERLRDYPWQLSYSTSAQTATGKPLDILHQFYIPVLKRCHRYDRVAGYFRSTSLAAASQGFSAFVGRQGRMRMVVGADLDPADVRAILDGTEEALTTQLSRELTQPEQWPEDVQRGVELLAWMIARRFLDIRVAFRVHACTGEPLTTDSRADGYVHEKWALFRDKAGDRLYVTGSFNESRTALVHNAENIDVHRDWTSAENRQRADEAEARFERVWNNENPSLLVLSLPEAVRQRLVQLAERVKRPTEIDYSSEAPLDVPSPSPLERLRFALLRDGPKLPEGRYVGMATAPIEPWPHQAVIARQLIDTWPYSYLLCDEVGLGKTIEAGLAIRSLYLAGLVKRVLICPPASLTCQWQRELASKFLLPFGRALGGRQPRHDYLFPFEEERSAHSLYAPDLIIVSTGLLVRQERCPDLDNAAAFDIALVDEAHYARRKNPTHGTRVEPRYGKLYRTLQQLRKKTHCLLLATATPMQLDPVEVADLIQLTRRVGAFQYDPSLLNAYYDLLGKLVRQERLNAHEWAFLHRAVKAVESQDPLLWQFIQSAVIDSFTRFGIEQWLADGSPPLAGDVEGVKQLIFAASPLSRVMLRHNRSLLEIYRSQGQLRANLARRVITSLKSVQFTAQEQRVYDLLEDYCNGLDRQLQRTSGNRNSFMLGMILSFLRLRFASSLFAIRETLRRRLDKVNATLQHMTAEEDEEPDEMALTDFLEEGEDDREAVVLWLKNRTSADLEWERKKLNTLLHELADLTTKPSKLQRLLEYLNKRRLAGGRLQQTVIFTRFYDTLTDIVGRLLQVEPDLLIGTYSGRGGAYLDLKAHHLLGCSREKIKQRFLRGEIDVLVCTDAAAEGLNLQTADLLINFDLPWNPMKVEQRIGRIDRIGQRHPTVFVSNLCYLNSAEEIVYGRLLQRLEQAGAIVGTQQPSLLPVTPEEFQELAGGILHEEALTQRALERATLAKRRTESMEIPADELYAIYVRLLERTGNFPPPVDLESIWQTLSGSLYLRALGCTLLPDPAQRMVMRGIPGVPDGVTLTVSREVYEQGNSALSSETHFATYGDPRFETILNHLASFPLPPCMQRLVVKAAQEDPELIGYAVATVGSDGVRATRLVTTWHELANLVIDEDAVLDETAVAALRQQLAALARREYEKRHAVARIEELNEAAGHSQQVLDCLVAHGLLWFRRAVGQAYERFWPELVAVDELLREREEMRITGIPSQLARQLSGLLFEPILPTVGEEGYIDAPRILLLCALDAAARLADSLHVAKAELSLDEVLKRLRQTMA